MPRIFEWTIEVIETRKHRVVVQVEDDVEAAMEEAIEYIGNDTVISQDFDDFEVVDKEYYGRY